MSSPDIAVIIPAYKARFLGKALESLQAQTCKQFAVYVGDDASPDDLKAVVEPFRAGLDLRYHRFDTNIGGHNLVAQWTRCVALSGQEPWIWLFSDDDVASENCVGEFLQVAQKFQSDVYRFNTHVIDERGWEISGTAPSPDWESSEKMALNLLYWRRGNSMPDHIFSREAFFQAGGFVDTPFAQGADWATSIRLSSRSGMRMVQDGLISWRQSGANVSSLAAARRTEVMRGHFRFIDWVLTHFRYLQEKGPCDGVTYADIHYAAQHNLNEVIIKHYRGLAKEQYSEYLNFLRTRFRLSSTRAFRELARIVLKTSVAGIRQKAAA